MSIIRSSKPLKKHVSVIKRFLRNSCILDMNIGPMNYCMSALPQSMLQRDYRDISCTAKIAALVLHLTLSSVCQDACSIDRSMCLAR